MTSRHILDDKQKKRIFHLHKCGMAKSLIAQRLGIARCTVYNVLKEGENNVALVQKVEMVSVATERKEAHSI